MFKTLSRERPVVWTLLGSDFQVDVASLLLLVPFGWTLVYVIFPSLVPGLPALSYWTMAMVAMVGFLFSLIVRATVSVLAARRLNVKVGRTVLFMLGASVHTPSHDTRPAAEIQIAAAGFLTALTLGVVFFLIFSHGFGDAPPLTFIGVAFFLAVANWGLGAFYLLPGYPLDGGRLLRAVLATWRKDMKWATAIAVAAGSILAIVLGAIGVYFVIRRDFIAGLWIIVAGVLLFRATRMAQRDHV